MHLYYSSIDLCNLLYRLTILLLKLIFYGFCALLTSRPVFVFLLCHLRCIPFSLVDMAIKQWSQVGHTSIEEQLSLTQLEKTYSLLCHLEKGTPL